MKHRMHGNGAAGEPLCRASCSSVGLPWFDVCLCKLSQATASMGGQDCGKRRKQKNLNTK
ncbi:hypothetical protein TYRP_014438 [Tyrophagus putrescentiae]|nr:hypothetical protein TYRP_014438 [Tyrophagus putrescentiae]